MNKREKQFGVGGAGVCMCVDALCLCIDWNKVREEARRVEKNMGLIVCDVGGCWDV